MKVKFSTYTQAVYDKGLKYTQQPCVIYANTFQFCNINFFFNKYRKQMDNMQHVQISTKFTKMSYWSEKLKYWKKEN